MSIYCTTTINGTDHLVSTEYLAEDHMWDAEIVDISQVTTTIAFQHGGYLRPVYGSIEFLPTLFVADWPPPQTITQKIETGDTEATKVLLCESICELDRLTQDSVRYTAMGAVDDVTNESYTWENTTLNGVFTWGCALLGLTLDVSNASRAASFVINHVSDTERLVLDLLSEASAFGCFYFYIADGTLYLVDLFTNTGTLSIDEFDFLPNTYKGYDSISLVKTLTVDEEFSVTGSTASGRPIHIEAWDTDETRVIDTLNDILTYLEKPLITVELANTEFVVGLGNLVSLFDESFIGDITATLLVTKKNLNYSAGSDKLVIEGRGTIT